MDLPRTLVLFWLNSFVSSLACNFYLSICLLSISLSKIFPPKNLEKYGRLKYACASLIFFYSVSNTWLKSVIFPPKDLEKIQAPKIRMRRFFLKKCVKDFITHICILLLSNKLNNVLVWFLFSFLNYFIQSICNKCFVF